MKMILECEVETENLEKFDGVQVSIHQGDDWNTVLFVALPKPHRVRNGKHLKIDKMTTKVIVVGGPI